MNVVIRGPVARGIVVLGLASFGIGCGEHAKVPLTAPDAPPAPAMAVGVPAPLPPEIQPVYLVDVSLSVAGGALSAAFPAVYGAVAADRGIAFFPSISPAVSVGGQGILTFIGGVAQGGGTIIIAAGGLVVSVDLAQFNGRRVDPFAGGIPGGGCIVAGGIPGGGDRQLVPVRLDFVPRPR